MKALGFNPYLPSWEFVPDGEPHVFDGRVYLYGSHDSRNGVSFCEGDYVVWSAPVNDPGNWRYEGVSYRKEQDPLNGAPYEGELPRIDMPLGTPENPLPTFRKVQWQDSSILPLTGMRRRLHWSFGEPALYRCCLTNPMVRWQLL